MRRMPLSALALVIGAVATTASAQGMGRHFFENWDLNVDGRVTLDEIVEKRSDVFASFDADDSGALDAEEFAMLDEARATHQEMMAEEREKERAERRENRPGQGRNEGQGGGLGGGQGGGHRLGDEAMNRELLDKDEDGLVTRDEFLDISLDWLTGLDKTGDGVVTPADFAAR